MTPHLQSGRKAARVLALGALVGGISAAVVAIAQSSGGMSGKPDSDMQAVLNEAQALGIKPLETLSTEQARAQPTPADAVKSLLLKRGKPEPDLPVSTDDRTLSAGDVQVPMRIYTPEGQGPFPVILYIHGGGWVIANIDTYDASARSLADGAKAVVVSTHYRQGPEFKYPAAHNDTYAAYKWTLANAKSINGDPKRVAVAGESAGGNMAGSIALRAKQDGIQQPVHQLLVYPVAQAGMKTESYKQNMAAKPLSSKALPWFTERYFRTPADGNDPMFNLLKANLAEVAPATVITAQIDPLRSEGKMLADKLEAAGVDTEYRNFEGVTHEFFGMGAVVADAKDAMEFGVSRLRDAFDAASSKPRTATANMDNADDVTLP